MNDKSPTREQELIDDIVDDIEFMGLTSCQKKEKMRTIISNAVTEARVETAQSFAAAVRGMRDELAAVVKRNKGFDTLQAKEILDGLDGIANSIATLTKGGTDE